MTHRLHLNTKLMIYGAIAIALLVSGPLAIRADEAEELRDKIEETQDQIDAINREIAAYEKQLQQVGAEKTTLQAAINELNVTRRKLLSDINLTQKQIEQTDYSIRELGLDIEETEEKIERNDMILAGAIRELREADERSLVENMLAYDALSDFWIELDQMESVQDTIYAQLQQLEELKVELEDEHAKERSQRDNLAAYKSKLSGQQKVVDENTKAKSTLLTQTQSKEAEYQKLLAEKQAARKQFETELQEYETKLAYVQDPSKLPEKGSGALAWPVENPVITQGFGITDFARSGGYGYDKNGQPNPHRGIDFRGTIGTPLLAAADGTVRDAYDMDRVPGCYSYGKWILIDHDNGLSTLYAHLSAFNVSPGDPVTRGQVIGFAGATGYSTGPHLHFTVFDQSAVKISQFSWSVGCKNARIAYAPYEAYLNPLSYLPQ